MTFRNSRFLVSTVYLVQVLAVGVVYAQSKSASPTVTVYKTPT